MSRHDASLSATDIGSPRGQPVGAHAAIDRAKTLVAHRGGWTPVQATAGRDAVRAEAGTERRERMAQGYRRFGTRGDGASDGDDAYTRSYAGGFAPATG